VRRAARWLASFLFAAGLLTGLLVMTLPVSNAVWIQELGVSGEVQVAAWTATLTATATATDTPPARVGTSLEAYKTAEGYFDGAAWGVRGQICVMNGGDWPTDGLTLTDAVQYKAGAGPYADLPGALWVLAPEPAILPGESACYEYQIPFAPVPGAQYRNTVRVTILNHSGWMPGGPHCAGPEACPFGPEPKAEFELPLAIGDGVPLATALPALAVTAPPHPTIPPPTFTPAPADTSTPSPEPSATPTTQPTATLAPTQTATPPLASPTPSAELPPTKTPELAPTTTQELPPTKTPELAPTTTQELPPTKTPLAP
jgi:hypothetical protein